MNSLIFDELLNISREHTKELGGVFESNMSLNIYIDNIVNKAQGLGFVLRNNNFWILTIIIL